MGGEATAVLMLLPSFLGVSVSYSDLFSLKRYQAFYLQFINFLYVVLLQYKSLKDKRTEMTLEEQT